MDCIAAINPDEICHTSKISLKKSQVHHTCNHMRSHGNVEECAPATLHHMSCTQENTCPTSNSVYLLFLFSMFEKELRVFFNPAVYSVPEGENQVLVLRADNEFAVPFTIDVTLRDGTAVGKYVECILPCTVHITV